MAVSLDAAQGPQVEDRLEAVGGEHLAGAGLILGRRLGEVVVGGQVEPDTYFVSRSPDPSNPEVQVISARIGSKGHRIVRQVDGTEARVDNSKELREARVLDDAGFSASRLNACGYGMGAVYAPIWVDWPMIYSGNPLTFDVGQTYFLHMILLDLDGGLAMNLGHTVVVTETGCERLSRSALDLVVNG